MTNHDDEDYFVPLVDQRIFGSGIKRKRIAFVPASGDEPAVQKTPKTSNAGDRYLAIVMKGREKLKADATADPSQESTSEIEQKALCPVCGQPVPEIELGERSHENSIAHQVCLEHSYGPSHLDRSHIGLRYMQECGWDPDARKGLGARQEGIRIPIKARQKKDTAGLGLLTKDEDEATMLKKGKPKTEDKQVVKLNAKEVRKLEQEKGRRAVKLRQSFYGEDLSQYLGSNG